MQQQIIEVKQGIPTEVQQQVLPLQKELEEQKSLRENQMTILENQKTVVEKQKATLEKLDERLRKVEERPQAIINQALDGTRQAAMMVGKSNTFKIPTFDGTGLWELYCRQFEAAAAHNRWTEIEQAVALTVHLKGAAQQVLAALPQSDTIECATLVNCLEQRLGQRHLTPVKRRELRNRI